MRRRVRIALIALFGVYVTLALAYCFANPLYESTDEIRHFRYVRHVAVYRSLPIQSPTAPRAQSHHPPLYYIMGAIVSGWVPISQDVYFSPPENPFWGYNSWEVGTDNKNLYVHGDDEHFPWHDAALAAYLVRFMTILIGAGAVAFTYMAGREAAPDHPELALAGASLLAYNPQFLYLSGAINNDVPAALCGAAILWCCLRLSRGTTGWLTDVLLASFYGTALLTKLNLLVLLAPIQLAYVIAAWRARDWRLYLRGTLIVLLGAAAISGWWFVRNWRLYGDPTGMSQVNELWAGRPASESWWALRQGVPYLWSSLWGRFGYGQIPLPEWVYQSVLLLCTVGMAGYFIRRQRHLDWATLLLSGVTVVTTVMIVLYYMLIQPAGAMGRFLFPSLPAFAILIVLGSIRFFADNRRWCVSMAIVAAAAGLAVGALVGVLVPAFAQPHLLTDNEIASNDARSINVMFGDIAQLIGYDVEPASLKPGETVYVTLYWQALARTEDEYAVFVHLLSEVGTMVAQRDTYPGLGRYPTTSWQPGSVFADTYRVEIPETAYAPDSIRVQVGLYRPGDGRLLNDAGSDTVQLAQILIDSRIGELPNSVDVNFGNQARLIGYGVDRRSVQPGDTVRLTLYWEAVGVMDTNYSVFAHVRGIENQVWARDEGWPVEGSAPTSSWAPGQIVEDVRYLTIGETTPDGLYDVEIGMYDPEVNRLPIIAEDGHWINNRIHLSRVRVISGE